MTYCSTVPSLAALEKRVHVVDPDLLAPQALVEYEVPDDLATGIINIGSMPSDWATRETHTQQIGDDWLDAGNEVILVVPSVIMPIVSAPDRNVLINHRREEVARISIVDVVPFTLDPRLFKM